MIVNCPTLLLDEKKCRGNIKMMADKAKSNNLVFRPHFKTHQSIEVGKWYKEEGVEAITVSSLGMAEYFANAGWQEITVAFPCNINQIELINQLAKSITLNMLVDNVQVINWLEEKLTTNVYIYIEVDSGGERTGVDAKNFKDIQQLISLIKSKDRLTLKGIYSHAGHTYKCKGVDEIKSVALKSIQTLNTLRSELKEELGTLEFCYGDTPSCSILDHFEGIDAISPGNFVFYDVMQIQIDSCVENQVAIALACPVVSINKTKSKAYVYAGGIHLSKDAVTFDNKISYGLVAKLSQTGWEVISESNVDSLSQEHGVISLEESELEKLEIGDTLAILPVHSCLTAQCMGEYTSLNGQIIDHYAKKSLSLC